MKFIAFVLITLIQFITVLNKASVATEKSKIKNEMTTKSRKVNLVNDKRKIKNQNFIFLFYFIFNHFFRMNMTLLYLKSYLNLLRRLNSTMLSTEFQDS